MRTLTLLLFLIAVLCLHPPICTAQTINYTPPVPPQQQGGTAGTVSLVAGVISCTITGAVPPANPASITVACSINSVTVPPYTVVISTSASYVLQHTFVTDPVAKTANAVTFGVAANPDGSPTLLWQAVATVGTMETASQGTL